MNGRPLGAAFSIALFQVVITWWFVAMWQRSLVGGVIHWEVDGMSNDEKLARYRKQLVYGIITAREYAVYVLELSDQEEK